MTKEYTAWEDNDSEMFSGGLTLRECKENVERVLLKEAREDNQDAYEDAILERRYMRNLKDACTTPSERFEAQEAIDIAQSKLDTLQAEYVAILERLKPLMPSHAKSMAQIRLVLHNKVRLRSVNTIETGEANRSPHKLKAMSKAKKDVYQQVTDRIIEGSPDQGSPMVQALERWDKAWVL